MVSPGLNSLFKKCFFLISVLWEIKLPKTNPNLKHKSGHKQPPPSFTVKKIERFYQRVEGDPLCVTSRLEINPRKVTEALSASPPTHITADRGFCHVTFGKRVVASCERKWPSEVSWRRERSVCPGASGFKRFVGVNVSNPAHGSCFCLTASGWSLSRALSFVRGSEDLEQRRRRSASLTHPHR